MLLQFLKLDLGLPVEVLICYIYVIGICFPSYEILRLKLSSSLGGSKASQWADPGCKFFNLARALPNNVRSTRLHSTQPK